MEVHSKFTSFTQLLLNIFLYVYILGLGEGVEVLKNLLVFLAFMGNQHLYACVPLSHIPLRYLKGIARLTEREWLNLFVFLEVVWTLVEIVTAVFVHILCNLCPV